MIQSLWVFNTARSNAWDFDSSVAVSEQMQRSLGIYTMAVVTRGVWSTVKEADLDSQCCRVADSVETYGLVSCFLRVKLNQCWLAGEIRLKSLTVSPSSDLSCVNWSPLRATGYMIKVLPLGSKWGLHLSFICLCVCVWLCFYVKEREYQYTACVFSAWHDLCHTFCPPLIPK